MLEVIRLAGAERVRELNISSCGDNLIIKNPAPRYQKSCKYIGNGWFCNTNTPTERKFAQITEINNRLKLGLKVEIIST